MAPADIAVRYAPLVVLHSEEKLLPASAGWFIEQSSLRWATGRGLDGDQVPDTDRGLDAGRLGAASENPYRYRTYAASALTRPLDDSASRGTDPPPGQGFFLRLREKAAARGEKSASPDASLYAGAGCYWDYDSDAKSMTYWLFYAGSAPPLGILHPDAGVRTRGAPGEPPSDEDAASAAAKLEEFRRAYPGLAQAAEPTAATRGFPQDVLQTFALVSEGVHAYLSDDNVLHEGDWERITLYLDERDPEGGPPVSVAFYRHATNGARPWASVQKEETTHAVVYSGIGSHASLPSPDFGYIDRGDAHGRRWRTWEQLGAVVDQPWYGFGGAWGKLGRVRDATGPLGPGAHWKHAAPRLPS
jgi:hypothetical protein